MSLNNSSLYKRQRSEYTFAYSGTCAGLSQFFNFSDLIPATWILDYNGWIPDCISWIPDSKAVDSRFHRPKLPGFRIPDCLTWGDSSLAVYIFEWFSQQPTSTFLHPYFAMRKLKYSMQDQQKPFSEFQQVAAVETCDKFRYKSFLKPCFYSTWFSYI